MDAVYNLEPACAQVGATFIVGTHRALVEELVTQLARGDTETLRDAGDFAVVRARPVADALQANFDALVMNSVLTEGKTLAAAREEVGGVIAIARLFDRVELRSDSAGDSVVHELVLELAPPERDR